ncbi:MAG: pyruvate dehydrogenase complex dihydrolipoamide acetyltransferase [Isosphaeraceae bacterium]
MPIEVKLAKLSPTMETGQMVQWKVKVGDTVKEGDTLAEIQTDKAVMPMEAFDEGVVALLDVQEGDDINLGQRVMVLAQKGEDPKKIVEELKGGSSLSGKSKESVAVRQGFDSQEETNSPRRPEAVEVPASAPSNGQEGSAGRVKSSPLARKIAAAAQIELRSVQGSGPGGRVIRRDVEAFLTRGPSKVATRADAPGESLRIAHSPMRKTIARRMLESKQAAPEIHVSVDIRLDKVMAIREALNQQLASEKIKLSLGDFVTKAVALSLRKHQGVNASYEADAIVIHSQVNVGIAVAIEGGLMVPVLHNADMLGLREIRVGTEALATATRNQTLKPAQMTGGTFTISNLGMYGVKQFDAIINQPEVAILAVGTGEKRPVVDGDQLVIGTVMSVTMTADHRAVDGALAAEFLRSLKGLLEEPASMLL